MQDDADADDMGGGFLPEENSAEVDVDGEEGGFVREDSESTAHATRGAFGDQAAAKSTQAGSSHGWKPDTSAPPTPDEEEEEDLGGGFIPEDVAAGDTPAQAPGREDAKAGNVRGWKPDTSAPPTPDAEEEEEEVEVPEDIGGGFLPDDAAAEDPAPDPSRQGAGSDPGPAMMVQPPTWACPEYRVVPVGGFIPEREDRGGAASGSAPLTLTVPGQAGKEVVSCTECGENAFNEQYRQLFSLIVCKPCIAAKEDKYKLMTKTAAKEEFLVNDGDLIGLNFLHKSNPRKEGWKEMKLYLRLQVRDVSWERWGGAQGVEAERARRASGQYERRRQLKQRETILRQQEEVERTPRAAMDDDGSGGLARLSKAARTTTTSKRKGSGGYKAPAVVVRHVHRWGEEWWDGEKKTWKKRCEECSKETSFEKL